MAQVACLLSGCFFFGSMGENLMEVKSTDEVGVASFVPKILNKIHCNQILKCDMLNHFS